MMDNDATLLNASPQVRQKRVLPSRSRRGGPGVGNCDVDIMILNAQLNKSDSDPLIPGDSPFVLKTSTALDKVAEKFQEAGSFGLNVHAHERYFDRPEVLKAYREQIIIETPQYERIGDVAPGGSRLRQRNIEETSLDLDPVYEKRHRKYEAFEKRNRLREKEKLKHEQYKLKERIEQLRGMDNSAFLAAHASSFSSPPTGSQANTEDIALGAMGVLGGLNGNPNTPAYQEGERRRQEMLMHALALEERYRVLLPPDRVRKPTGHSAANAETDSDLSSHEPARSKDAGESEDPAQTSKKLKIRLPGITRMGAPASANTTPKDSPASKKRPRPSPPLPTTQVPTHPPMSRSARETIPQARLIMAAPSHTSYPDQIQFAQPYSPDEDQRAPKRQRLSKRARTEERNERRPQTPSRDLSVPLPDQGIVVVEEDPSFQNTSPTTYSYPPPRPPPDIEEKHHRSPLEPNFPITSPPESIPLLNSTSPVLAAPSGSHIPEPYASQHSPLSDLNESQVFENTSVPGRERSLPPIEALSSLSAPAAPSRRGRSRGARGGATPGVEGVTRTRKTAARRLPDVMILTTAQRNRHKSHHRRGRNDAWGCKLPEIIMGNDSYAYELPDWIQNKDEDDKMELDGLESGEEEEEAKEEEEEAKEEEAEAKEEEEEDRKDQLVPMQDEPESEDSRTELDVGT